MARIPRKFAGIGAADMENSAEFDTYVGPSREITVDPIRGIIALHDDETPGGKRFATAAQGAKADTALQTSGGTVPNSFTLDAPSGFVTLTSLYQTVNSRSIFTEDNKEWLGNGASGSATQYAYGNFAQGVFLSSLGDVGVVGATRTEDITTSGRLSIGTMGWGFNFKTTNPQTSWGGYFEARRKTGAGQIHGVEINVTELGSSDVTIPTPLSTGPNAAFASTSSALNLAVGGNTTIAAGGGWNGSSIAYAVDAGVLLTLYGNGAKAHKGIIIAENAIVGADGTGGSNTGTAIELARGHLISWIDGTTRQGAKVYSDVSYSGDALEMVFTDFGLLVRSPSAGPALQVVAHSDDAVGVMVTGGSSAENIAFMAASGVPNANLGIAASGSGTIQHFSPTRLMRYTVADLPTASSNYEGCVVVVTDHNASPVYGATPVGGGSNKAMVFCDGTTWRIN